MMQRAARGVIPASSIAASSSSSTGSCAHHSRRAFIEINDALCGSSVQCRGRSFIALVPSDSTMNWKGRKRMPKDERRAVVEGFVEKYRAANVGKFPTASHTRQQVGGSYYVIREIIQKLEYESKVPSVDKREKVVSELRKEAVTYDSDIKEQQSLTEMEEASSSCISQISTSHEHSTVVKVGSTIINNSEIDESLLAKADEVGSTIMNNSEIDESLLAKADEASNEPLAPSCVRSSDSDQGFSAKSNNLSRRSAGALEETATPSEASFIEDLSDNAPPSVRKLGDIVKSAATLDAPPTNSGESETCRENTSDRTAGQEGDTKKGQQNASQEVSKPEGLHKEYSGELEREDPKRSSVWDNLRSFADGFINFWKKM